MRLFGRRSDGPVATYAAVLDGAHLWLDLDGAVSLRDAATGEEATPMASPVPLAVLRGDSYQVLAGGQPVQLAAAPPDRAPARTPLAPDGVSQWHVVRTDDGALRLTRHRVARAALLETIELRGDRVHLRLDTGAEVAAGVHLLLLDPDDGVLATLPVTAHGRYVEALVGGDDLPAGWFGMLRVAVGTDGSWLRVRRRANDLADPNHATLLPELEHARFRWSPDGLLVVRALDPARATSGEPT